MSGNRNAWGADIGAPSEAGGRVPGYFPGSVPQGAAPPVPADVVGLDPWYVTPSPSRFDLFASGILSIDGAATAGAWQTVATEKLPAGVQGVYRSFVMIVVGTVTAGTRVDARIVVDTTPKPGWDVVPIPAVPATSATLAFGPDETFVMLPANADVQLQARVTDGLVYQVQLIARGWKE